MDLTSEKLIEMYRVMLKIRRFEEKVAELFERGDLAFAKGFIHLYIGEEAVAVGACANLRKEDYITGTHRGHGHCIAKEPETAFKAIESTIVRLISNKILKILTETRLPRAPLSYKRFGII